MTPVCDGCGLPIALPERMVTRDGADYCDALCYEGLEL